VFYGGGGVFMIYIAKKMEINAEKLKKYIAIVINNNQTSIDIIAAAVPVDEPQIKGSICRSCGANNKVVKGQICECEYCGSLLV
jgi:hypothetical protein